MGNKKILIFDEPYITQPIGEAIRGWGYDVIELSKPDFLIDVVKRSEVDLAILAHEMRISGPSLFENLNLGLAEAVAQVRNTKIDFSIGVRFFEQFLVHDISVPVIFFSTSFKTQFYRKPDDRKLCCPIISKFSPDYLKELKEAVDELLTVG